MAYIGKQPVVGNFVKLDAITTSATATYNLLNGGVAYFPQTANNCIVSLNGVIQSPTSAYTISGSTIVFDSALTSADSIDFILVLGDVLSIGTPSDGTITSAKLASGVAGLIAWQSIVTAATLTAVSGRGYWINTTSNACTVTLPASATAGDTIILVDYARKFGTNAVTINQNSLNFQGATTPNPIYNTDGQSVTLVYSGATQGWIPTVDDNVTLETPQPYSVDFLVIAGGASGGGARAAGGGAGGYRTSTQTVSPGTVITVTVGDGGASVTGNGVRGNNGSNSSISGSGLTTITSTGGGGGGGANGATDAGGNGGSGGGSCDGAANGSGNTPSTSPSQGNNGGVGAGGPNYGAGGGGGASAVGANGTTTVGGNGGNGTASSITGSSVTRAGGGGGATYSGGTAGQGGTGGGGNANVGAVGSAGTANTGGGGGGGYHPGNETSGAGGKGVVILSLPTASYSSTTTGSPTVTTSGSNTILQFNGSGSYTA
jgi:hypothetical protein